MQKLAVLVKLLVNKMSTVSISELMESKTMDTINRLSASTSPTSDHEYASKKIKLDDDFIDEESELGSRSDQHYKAYKVSEKDAFITEFIGNHCGFTGEIKQRYSDFMVHEIDESGAIVQLTNIEVPQEDDKPINPATESVAAAITPEIHQKLNELSINKQAEPVQISVDTLEKDERTKIHKYIKENFKGLETNYSDKDGKKFIIAIRRSQAARQNTDWVVGRPDFVHFVLYQENYGTLEAIEKIAHLIGRQPKAFTYAGTKDKRSISTQRVSVYRQDVKRLIGFNDICKKSYAQIMVGNVSYNKEGIRLGQTSGNRFDLVIRDLVYKTENDVREAFENVNSKGFINYFGTQRFGMSASPSHSIGLAVLKEDWLGVLDLILSERKIDIEAAKSGRHKSFNECMRIWKQTRDPEAVLKELSFRNSREARILKGIMKSGSKNNYYAGFCQITRNQRMLYLHSYQSLLWNQLASFRIQRYGFKVVPGDLLIGSEEKLNQADDIRHIKPRLATEIDIDSATIDDVVLPILGVSSILPENEVKDKLLKLLEQDGIDINAFNLKWKELFLAGTYRPLICRPKNMDMKIVSYADNTQPLFETDLDKLKDIQCNVTPGPKKALKLSFTLPSSTYATIMLREMMKQDIIVN